MMTLDIRNHTITAVFPKSIGKRKKANCTRPQYQYIVHIGKNSISHFPRVLRNKGYNCQEMAFNINNVLIKIAYI